MKLYLRVCEYSVIRLNCVELFFLLYFLELRNMSNWELRSNLNWQVGRNLRNVSVKFVSIFISKLNYLLWNWIIIYLLIRTNIFICVHVCIWRRVDYYKFHYYYFWRPESWLEIIWTEIDWRFVLYNVAVTIIERRTKLRRRQQLRGQTHAGGQERQSAEAEILGMDQNSTESFSCTVGMCRCSEKSYPKCRLVSKSAPWSRFWGCA